MRHWLVAAGLAITGVANAQCTPEMIRLDNGVGCGSAARIDGMVAHPLNGVRRVFGVHQHRSIWPDSDPMTSGLAVLSDSGWGYFGNESFHRNTSLLSVPATEERFGRVYAVGYPAAGASEWGLMVRWLRDDAWSGFEGRWVDWGRIGVHGSVPAVLAWDDNGWPQVMVGGDFRNGPLESGPLVEGCPGGCDPAMVDLARSGESHVRALAYFASSATAAPSLYAGGMDLGASGSSLVRWNGSVWEECLAGPLAVTGLKVHNRSLWITTTGGLIRYDGTSYLTLPGLAGIECIEWFDDGHGERLFAGGSFARAAGAPADQVAVLEGGQWQQVGPGFFDSELTPVVKSLVVADIGGLPRLVAGGHFSRVGGKMVRNTATWDGVAWKGLGTADVVRSAVHHDDGTGRDVYWVTWSLRNLWNSPTDRVVRMRNGEVEMVGDDFPMGSTVDHIYSLDLGSGPRLYAVGSFAAAPGGVAASGIAEWNGQEWRGLGEQVAGQVGQVRDVTVWDEDGPGPLPKCLYVIGAFDAMGTTAARNAARWDGSNWHAMGGGLPNPGAGIGIRQWSDSRDLVVATEGGQLAQWNGEWTFGAGVGVAQSNGGKVLAVMDSGNGPEVYVNWNAYVYRWNGVQWSTLQVPMGWVEGIESFDDGHGPALYLGGWDAQGMAMLRWTPEEVRRIDTFGQGARELGLSHDGQRQGLLISSGGLNLGLLYYRGCGEVCGTSDFDGDGDFGTDGDVQAFFACLAGVCCSTCYSGGADFNADGDSGTDADIESFFRVLAGGAC